jgi:toxin FitB
VADSEPRGVLDTCTFIDFELLSPEVVPDIPEITSITLGELHQGVALAKSAQARATRLERLNMAIEQFEPLPFDGEAAGRYGTLVALTAAHGRSFKQRRFDLMIAAVASVHELPLYTRNPDDFRGLDSLLRVIAV